MDITHFIFPNSIDWFKGQITGQSHDLHGKIYGFRSFRLDFPLSRPIFPKGSLYAVPSLRCPVASPVRHRYCAGRIDSPDGPDAQSVDAVRIAK